MEKDLAANYFSKFSQESACGHQKAECNGCPLMPLPYEKQLEFKAELLRKILGREVEIEPAPAGTGYRNRVDLSYINGKLGYRHRDDFYVSFQLENCLLVSGPANSWIQKISRRLGELKIAEAGIMGRKPGLGYVDFRENRKREGMANFVFFGEVDKKIKGLCEELIAGGLAGANILFNETWGDTAYGTVVQTFGAPHIEEEMLGNRFLVNPNTFFQTNVQSAEKIFSILATHLPTAGNVLDLYCGVGTLTLLAAQKCARVVGIESNFESASGARKNAILNGYENAAFIYAGVEKMLKGMKGFETVIADPPRTGMHPKAIKALLELAPKKIIYVSCNPKTLAFDLAAMQGYGISYIRAFDQFPQTMHIEILCVLEKKEAA